MYIPFSKDFMSTLCDEDCCSHPKVDEEVLRKSINVVDINYVCGSIPRKSEVSAISIAVGPVSTDSVKLGI